MGGSVGDVSAMFLSSQATDVTIGLQGILPNVCKGDKEVAKEVGGDGADVSADVSLRVGG